MFTTGDIVHFYNKLARPNAKNKYSLCIGSGCYFLFLSSPKYRTYRATLPISLDFCTGLPSNEEGVTIVSVLGVFKVTNEELKLLNAKKVGVMNEKGINIICKYISDAEFLTEDQKEELLIAFGDFL